MFHNHSQGFPIRMFVIIGLLTLSAAGAANAQTLNLPIHQNPGLTVTIQGLGGNCLDVLNANSQPGAQVDNFSCNGTAAQVFRLNYDGTVTNFAGKCLDVLNANAGAGILDFTNCNGTAAQQWTQKGTQFVGLAGECLDVQYGNPSPGTVVDLATCNGTPAQNWHIINTPTVLQGPGTTCLDIINSNTSPGARLQIFECNRGPNAQIFTFTSAGEIRNAVGECLDVMYGNAAGGQVQMTTCNGTAAQKWQVLGRQIVGISNGLFSSCLGAVDSFGPGANPRQTAQDHTAVGLVACNGTEAQQWIAADLYVPGPATLLIVTSEGFANTFASFISHKQSIGVPTKLLTMRQVRTAYPASDDALSLKYAIEDHYRNFGTRFVLLGGDAAHVPVRYRQVLDGSYQTSSFVVSDLYYENLYSGHAPFSGFHSGGFDTWDSNGNGLYDEQSWNDPLTNPDNVDGFPDVAVGRIPAYNTTVLAAALNKIINYENQTNFPPVNKFGWVADACYPGYGNVLSIASGNGQAFFGYAEEVGQTYSGSPCNAPNAGPNFDIDTNGWSHFQAAVQNSQYEWVTYVGHGFPSGWGGADSGATYWTGSQTAQLSNAYLPIVFAIACQTGQWETWLLLEPLSYRPPVYDPNAFNSSSVNIGAQWLFNPNGGAVAYVGENIVMQDDAGTGFMRYVFGQRANGFARLGDMWRMAQQEYFDYNFSNPGYDNHFSAPRIYLGVVNLLGDPSMRTK